MTSGDRSERIEDIETSQRPIACSRQRGRVGRRTLTIAEERPSRTSGTCAATRPSAIPAPRL